MPSLFELILGSAAKNADLLRERGAEIMTLPTRSVGICPTREELDRLQSIDLTGAKCVGIYDPDLKRFVTPVEDDQ